jgi:toxin ParE1/3/4
MRYRISDDAEVDLHEIFLYWAERINLTIADRVIDGIVERLRLLDEFPEAGRSSNDIASGVRCFPAGEYLIYYRRSRKYTDILHVFHGARKQARAVNKKTRKSRN